MQPNPTPAVVSSGNSTIDRADLRPLPVPAWLRTGFRMTGAVAPAAAARLALRLCFTPPRPAVRPAERAVLARARRFSFDAAGSRLAAWSWGSGPATVLLVHGWGGHAGQMTALVEPLCAAGCRVVALDMPGHGESTGRLSSLVHFAAGMEGAAALCGRLDGVVAHSFGAAAATFALARGWAAERLVFFAPPAHFVTFWARFRAALGVSEPIWRRVIADAERWLGLRFEGIAPADLAPAMTAPLLVLHGTGDREMPFAEGEELVRRWPGARLLRQEGLGHLRILRDPSAIAEAVAFLGA
jgi:pimeloyl-ACP methyl ester carboxylesterase